MVGNLGGPRTVLDFGRIVPAADWRLTMDDDLERKLVEAPDGERERAALACLVRMRGEGKSVEEIAAGLKAETGAELSPDAVDRVLRRVAGPAPRETGGDPEYFSGYLGGG